MDKQLEEAARLYHKNGRPGKIEVKPTKPYRTQYDLTLAYSPGVAVPCLDIQEDQHKAYEYTAKGNLVGVISNGTAVLGLGDIGALSGKPVMEGKGLLFKIYADIDVFDIEVNEKDPDKFVEAVKAIAPTFGGINLEDIKAPECFVIEDRLKKELDIPVMHDDQHGTAIISAAGLLNALIIAGKKIEDVKIVVNGAGASAFSCTKLYESFGARHENILMLDSKGVITKERTDLNDHKAYFATDRTDVHTLEEAIRGVDVFVGLSRGGVLKPEMVLSMAENPIVFALANPTPEIEYDLAVATRPDVIMATGRSDYPNQINNVIGFPYIFRGALDTMASCINEEMKRAATLAIAALAREAVPDAVNQAYGSLNLHFGKDYFIPKPVDTRLISRVATAVAKAAIESGVACKTITDWNEYAASLEARMGYTNHLTRRLHDSAKLMPKKIVFAVGEKINMLKAASRCRDEGIAIPILLGDETIIQELARKNDIEMQGMEIIALRSEKENQRRLDYAKAYADKNWRNGINYNECVDKMFDRNYFGMQMVEMGDADALITGMYSNIQSLAEIAQSVVGLSPGVNHFATMHVLTLKQGPLFIADTLINRNLSADALFDIICLVNDKVRSFGFEPVIAVVSYSNFDSTNKGVGCEVQEAIKRLQNERLDIIVDGEMQIRLALSPENRDRIYPNNRLNGRKVNTLIFPRLTAANVCYQILKEADETAEVIGPISMGLNKPIYFTENDASIEEISNLAAIASLEHSVCIIPEGRK